MYVFGSITSFMVPDFVQKIMTAKLSQAFTLAFSNVPGILKPIMIGQTEVVGMTTCVIPAGKTGICISILSYTDSIRVSILSDAAILTS